MAKKPTAKPSKPRRPVRATPMAHLAAEPVSATLEPGGSVANLLLRAGETGEWMVFVRSNRSEKRVSYAELLGRAGARLAGLRAAGAQRGESVLQVFADGEEFVVTLWACLLGGFVNVPLTYPMSLDPKSPGMQKMLKSWEQLGKPLVLGEQALAEHFANTQGPGLESEFKVIVASEVDQPEATPQYTPGHDDELALIQYSSGSTGHPKGVELTHRNLLTNLEAINMRIQPQPDETVMSWMPFSHDMGLSLHLWPVSARISQVNMPPTLFVRRPLLWLEKMSEYRSAFSGSPNFGYRLVLDQLTPEVLARLDLSALRVIFNGAEPISVPVMREFTQTLAAAQLRASAVYPVYGMAEACVAVAFPVAGSLPVVRSVARSHLSAGGQIVPVAEDDPDAMLIVDEGTPVPGCELRVVDDHDELLPQEVVGHVQIRGGNITAGYHRLPAVTREAHAGDWLRTGDLGFVANGRLSITGRAKDIVIVNGQKFFAYDIEQCAGQVPGMVATKVVACGWHDASLGRERVVLFATPKLKSGTREDKARVLARAWAAVNATFGFALDEVVVIPSAPRTTSGKLQRFQVRDAFLAGEYADSRFSAEELLQALNAADVPADAAAPMVAPPPTSTTTTPPAPTRERTTQDALIDPLRRLWAQVLQRDAGQIGLTQPFLEIGGSSIKAMQLLGRVEQAFDTELTHDFLLQCRTLGEMAAYLARHLNTAPAEQPAQPAAAPAGAGPIDDDIAIIAMACRFPDADTPEAFWSNLIAGRDSITGVPGDRWNVEPYYSADASQPGKTVSRWGGFLGEAFAFDAEFFGMTAEEARIMDPQQRLLMQASHEALERAGYAGAHSEGQRIGVFAGASHNNYMEHHQHGVDLQRLHHFDSFAALDEAQRDALTHEWLERFGDPQAHPNTMVDNLLNMIAARTAHALNLKGPALAIDTACSSSLVAVHLAAESLRRGECEMALAGGVNLNLSPTPYLLFSRAGALSPTGRCKVFDESADGFVPGEGVGVVVLKPLSRALADGDRVLAVVKRSCVNNDGHSLGVMAPNPDGQRVAIAAAYRDADLQPRHIQYVEAHGTGTALGDPSELRALSRVFAERGVEAGSCVVGSVKANIGHLLAAAGVASLIKLVLALQHRQMPPSLHVLQPNAQLLLPGVPLRVISEAQAWEAPAHGPRRGAINSFGFGGTNCHMVIEDAPVSATAEVQPAPQRPLHLLALSARTAPALGRRAAQVARHLQAHPELAATDVAHSLQVGQTHFKHRLAVVGDSTEHIASQLEDEAQRAPVPPLAAPQVALMFTGQGAQYRGMARSLYASLPAFRRHADACAAAFDPHLGQSLLACLYADDADEATLAQTWLTQPVMFTIDYCLGRLLMDWGVRPACLLGHSVGEYAAACLAGVMSLEDAARVVTARGRLIYALPAGGGMMAVFDTQEALAPMLAAYEGRLWFAAHNGQHQVVSGRLDAITELQSKLQPLGKVCRQLQVSHAFHTPLLAPMLAEFEQVLASVAFQPARIPLVSNLGGRWIEAGQTLAADYWLAHIPAPVCFEQSVRQAVDKGITVFAECGPDKVLANLTRGIVSGLPVQVLPTLERRREEWDGLLHCMGALYRLGIDLDWRAFDADAQPHRVDLPTYPFERTELRIHTRAERGHAPVAATAVAAASHTARAAMAIEPPPAPARVNSWQDAVQDLLAHLLNVRGAEVDTSRNFHELGLNSASAVEMAERLSVMTGTKLPPTLLFEYQSPAALVEYLQAIAAAPRPELPVYAPAPAPAPAPTPVVLPHIVQPRPTPAPLPTEQAPLRDHDIAIIGMALRLPGADTPEAFWSMLMEGRTAIREVRPDQWSTDDYFGTEQRSHTTYSKWGAFIDRPYDFDPMFFGISPRETEVMDPQQRLFLQVAWEALQQSGYGGEYRTREIGVFVGSEQNHYGEHFVVHQRYQALCERFQHMPWFKALDEPARLQLLTTLRDVLQPAELISDAVAGNGLNEIPARLSHWLDLRGPALMVNTACSSSLVALHLACESLRNGDSRIAVAGAAYLTDNDSPFVFLSRVGALSPNGRCAPFDARANGMVLGEGVSAVVLKPLKDAVADGDNVLAVIKGSAVNNDGHSNGITAPNPRGQAEALRKAYVNAGLSPEQVSYIECHGTGTPLGDPVELDGMTQAFRKFTDRKQYCAVGSLKSTFGHMLSGASLPSLIKVVLSLRHRTIPPTLGYETPNPHIDFAQTPFYVVAGRPASWQANGDQPLRAGVNSFGFGGTNCHAVLEEAPRLPQAQPSGPPRSELLLLNGRTPAVLQEVAARLLARVQEEADYQPEQIALTFNGSQRELAYRTALIVRDRADMLHKLRLVAQGEAGAEVWTRRTNPKAATQVHLVFDGISPYSLAEVEALVAEHPQLQSICDECKGLHQQAMSHSHVLNAQHLEELIHNFAVQYGLGRMLMNTELRPTALLAEGTGVLVAACLLGMLTLRQGIEMLGRLAMGRHDGLDTVLQGRDERGEHWHCPLVIADAVLERSDDAAAVRLAGYLQQPRRLSPRDLQLSTKSEHAVVHLGGTPQMRQQLQLADAVHWIDLGHASHASERLLALFAGLHLHGVRFNPRPLVREGVRRVLLPTYPFENKPYRFKTVAVPGAPHETVVAAAGMPTAASTAASGAPAAAMQHPAPAASSGVLAPLLTPGTPAGQLKPLHGAALSGADRQSQAEALQRELSQLAR